MKIINWLLILSMLSFVACSSSEDGDTEDEFSEVEESEFEIDGEDESEDDIIANEELEEGTEIQEEIITASDAPMNVEFEDQSAPILSDNLSEYTVQGGDTMMMVAFKVYGDYGKWRNIANMNPNIDPHNLTRGTVLKYNAPMEAFSWQPKGKAHLIRRGETLGTISNSEYGTPKMWKDIYSNNRPMIKNPNLIFAGFTLYLLAKRDLASE